MEGNTGQLDDLCARLAAVGLEPKDATLYVHLCVHGPTKASDAAAAAKLNRTEAYRALDNLIRRGFVTASLDRPTLYEATPPEKVFDDAIAAHHARRASIERARESALETLERLRGARTPGGIKLGYRMLQGRPTIYSTVEGMVRRARTSQAMVSTFFAAANATDANSPYQTTIQRAGDGLRMQLLLRESPGLQEALAPLVAHPNVEARIVATRQPLRFTIVDDREIVTWLVSDPAPSLGARDDVAMWTNAPDFVAAHRLLFDAVWESSKPVLKKLKG